MATILRLRRTGTTNVATFRLIATDQRCRRDGRFIEILGNYDPRRDGNEKLVVDAERVQYWIDNGALISDAVRPLLKNIGLVLPVRTTASKKRKAADTATATQEDVVPAVVAEEAMTTAADDAADDAAADDAATVDAATADAATDDAADDAAADDAATDDAVAADAAADDAADAPAPDTKNNG